MDQKHGQLVDLEVLDEDPGEDDELGVLVYYIKCHTSTPIF